MRTLWIRLTGIPQIGDLQQELSDERMRNSSAKQELLDSQARLDECRKKIANLEEANLGLGQRADNLERFTSDRNITNNQDY